MPDGKRRVSRFEVAPAELQSAAGALAGFCAHAHRATGQLHQAGSALAGGLTESAAGYQATDRSAMAGRG